MKNAELKDIEIYGELAVRMINNMNRLQGETYRPDEVFTADAHDWPGDWEGRLILALSLYQQATGCTLAYLDRIVEELPEHFNERGYMGRLLPEGHFAEQHMAGHSWLIRGLIEYYKLTNKPSAKKLAQQIVKNFLMPVKGSYSVYPLTLEERENNVTNWVLSPKQSKVASHADTSDAGCAFIMIDGATAAYEFFGGEELHDLIAEMIDRYSKLDFTGAHIQTHATLSGMRGTLRFYELTGEKKYLDLAERVFGLYKTEAWSEAYGNYNWFGIPSWTEPCAIIDSFIAAVWLWKNTGNQQYLIDAYKIYYNAVGHANRKSGAFGTDNCVGAEGAENPTCIVPCTYDVFWCCNMRGGECLTQAARFGFFTEKNKIYNAFYQDSRVLLHLDAGNIVLETRSMYPYYGSADISVASSDINENIELYLFIPEEFSENIKISVNGSEAEYGYEDGFARIVFKPAAGDKIAVSFDLKLAAKDAVHKHTKKGYHKYFYGPLLLTYKKEAGSQDISLDKNIELEHIKYGRFKVKGSNILLSSLFETRDMAEESSVRQVMFKEGAAE